MQRQNKIERILNPRKYDFPNTVEEQAFPPCNRLEIVLHGLLREMVLQIFAIDWVALKRQSELAAGAGHAGSHPLRPPLGTRYLHPRDNVGALHFSAQIRLRVHRSRVGLFAAAPRQQSNGVAQLGS